MKMRSVKTRLATVCNVVVPEKGYQEGVERDLAVQYLIYFRTRFSELHINLKQIAIEIDVEKHARVSSLVQLSGRKAHQPVVLESYKVEISLTRFKGDWQVEKVILPNDLLLSGLNNSF